jgi:MtN3 and saliva related transmembrane protein
MNLDITSIIGYLAGAATTVAFLPQVIKVIRTKQTRDISLLMYIVFLSGIVCWEIYGILLNQYPIIIANSITFFSASTVLIYKIKYK